jgi:hypothetical protein
MYTSKDIEAIKQYYKEREGFYQLAILLIIVISLWIL